MSPSAQGERSGLCHHHDFKRLWTAQIVSAVGSRVTRTALPIIAIVSLDASPVEMAAIGILSLTPALSSGYPPVTLSIVAISRESSLQPISFA